MEMEDTLQAIKYQVSIIDDVLRCSKLNDEESLKIEVVLDAKLYYSDLEIVELLQKEIEKQYKDTCSLFVEMSIIERTQKSKQLQSMQRAIKELYLRVLELAS